MRATQRNSDVVASRKHRSAIDELRTAEYASRPANTSRDRLEDGRLSSANESLPSVLLHAECCDRALKQESTDSTSGFPGNWLRRRIAVRHSVATSPSPQFVLRPTATERLVLPQSDVSDKRVMDRFAVIRLCIRGFLQRTQTPVTYTHAHIHAWAHVYFMMQPHLEDETISAYLTRVRLCRRQDYSCAHTHTQHAHSHTDYTVEFSKLAVTTQMNIACHRHELLAFRKSVRRFNATSAEKLRVYISQMRHDRCHQQSKANSLLHEKNLLRSTSNCEATIRHHDHPLRPTWNSNNRRGATSNI
jgi:hypothetical protein